MKKWKILLLSISIIALLAAPVASGKPPPCGNPFSPICFQPFYANALGDVNSLMGQMQEKLGELDDPSPFSEQLDAINALISRATIGANYIYQKDLLLMAKAMLMELLPQIA